MFLVFQSAASLSGGSEDGTNNMYDSHMDDEYMRVSHTTYITYIYQHLPTLYTSPTYTYINIHHLRIPPFTYMNYINYVYQHLPTLNTSPTYTCNYLHYIHHQRLPASIYITYTN